MFKISEMKFISNITTVDSYSIEKMNKSFAIPSREGSIYLYNEVAGSLQMTQKIEIKDAKFNGKVCRVTNDQIILTNWKTLMLYNISNKTLISTLKCGDKILSIKKISSNYFIVRERKTLSLVTLIENNKLVRTVILERCYNHED